MKTIVYLLALVAMVVFLTGCPSSNCTFSLDFEAPLAVGTLYGQPVGTPPGMQLFTVGNITATSLEFTAASGGRFYEYTVIEAAPAGFTGTQVMRFNNMSIILFLGNAGFSVSEVSFDYLDLGGTENLSTGAFQFVGEITDAPAAVTAQTVSVTSSPVPGGKKGTVTIKGANIDKVVIGGQEFWMDNLCVR